MTYVVNVRGEVIVIRQPSAQAEYRSLSPFFGKDGESRGSRASENDGTQTNPITVLRCVSQPMSPKGRNWKFFKTATAEKER